MAIKITEMTEATQVNNNDWLMIVQNGENKKITKENLQDSIVDAELEERVDTLEDDVEALQEENAYLNNLVNQAFDKKEVEGEELSIDDTINAKMEVNLKGNTKQETTTGKQLFDKSNVNVLNAYIDNTNGNIGSDTNARCIYIPCKANTTYTVSKTVTPRFIVGLTSSIPANNVQCLSYIRNDSATSITIEGNANAQYLIVYLTNNYDSNTWNSILDNIMIKEGSTVTPYEKYTGGIASPNPDYPQEVNVVTGDNTIVVSNKNLFDKNNLTNNYRLDSNGQPYADNGYALTDYIKVQPNTQYTRNIDFAWNVPICLYDINKNFISRIQTGKTITTTNDTYYVRTDVATANIDITQLEINSTVTPYTPHQEQTFQINLGNIEVCGIGNYQDYFYKSNNKWYLHKQIGKVVLNGTETWNYTIPNKFTLLQDINMKAFDINTTGYLFCDYYTERANADIDNYDYAICRYGTSASYNYNKIVIKDKDCTTTTQLNNKLSTNNTTIYYVLTTPTNTEITDTTLISQLEALKTAMSYAGQTNISQINNDAPFILQVTALASYNSRILALENAILNANRNVAVENSLRKASSNEIIEESKEEVVDKEEVEEPKEENKEER